jgi:hypothetical protein
MSLEDIAAGSWGYELELVWEDTDTRVAEDLSGYTTAQNIIIIAPDGSENEVTGSFSGNGTDGKVKITVADGAIPKAWKGKAVEVRIAVESPTGKVYSKPEEFTPV